MTDTKESCPKCGDGVLYVTAEAEKVDTLHCFNCNHNETRPAKGYTLDPDTKEIVKTTKRENGKPKGAE